jgi:hypothetical protein
MFETDMPIPPAFRSKVAPKRKHHTLFRSKFDSEYNKNSLWDDLKGKDPEITEREYSTCQFCGQRLMLDDTMCINKYDKSKLNSFLEMVPKLPEHSAKWRAFSTGNSLGFGPHDLQTGDSIWLIGSEPQLYVLRQDNGRRYKFVGPGYIHGALSKSGDCCKCSLDTLSVPDVWESIEIWCAIKCPEEAEQVPNSLNDETNIGVTKISSCKYLSNKDRDNRHILRQI